MTLNSNIHGSLLLVYSFVDTLLSVNLSCTVLTKLIAPLLP